MTRRKLNLVVVSMVLLLGVAVYAHGRPGDLDPAFGTGGFAGPRGNPNYVAWPPVPAPDGTLRMLEVRLAKPEVGCTVWACPGTSHVLTRLGLDGRPVPNAPDVTVDVSPARNIKGWIVQLANGDMLLPLVADLNVASVLRLDPLGQRRTGFGSAGTVQVSESTSIPQLPIEGISEGPDGRLLVLEGAGCFAGGVPLTLTGAFSGSSDSRSWGLPLTDSNCGMLPLRPRQGSLARLLADGRLDTSFGTNGRLDVSTLGAVGSVWSRVDGTTVLVDRTGQIRLLDSTGRLERSTSVDLQDVSAAALADGRILLTGRRDADRELWIARLRSDLEVDTSFGSNNGMVRIDFGQVLPGRTDLGVYPGELIRTADAKNAYLALNLATQSNRDYLCGGVLRLSLDPTPVVDTAFGSGGFDCISRSGWILGRTRLTELPDGNLLVSLPDLHALDQGKEGLVSILVRTGDAPDAPGMLSIQGMTSWSDTGSVRIVAGRAGGSRGTVAIGWRAVAQRHPGRPTGQSGSDRKQANIFLDEEVPGPEILGQGVLQWPDNDGQDRAINLSIADSVRLSSDQRCALDGMTIELLNPVGGVMHSRVVHRVGFPQPQGGYCVFAALSSVSGEASAGGGTSAVVETEGGGALGVSGLLGLLACAEFARRRRLRRSSYASEEFRRLCERQ